MMNRSLWFLKVCCFIAFATFSNATYAQNRDGNAGKRTVPAYAESVPKPTQAMVRYGDHERHVLDFWQAPSDKPTPLVLVIHGGAWKGGSKERLDRFADTNALLNAGISVVAINYRLMAHSQEVTPPVKAPLHDAARALQFVRSKAKQWNLDKERIAAAGGSAGRAPAFGWPITTIWLILQAKTPSHASPLDFSAWPSGNHRLHSTRNK